MAVPNNRPVRKTEKAPDVKGSHLKNH